MIKAVFCDLDGTLLHGECGARISRDSIPIDNQIILRKLIDSGVQFIPSSGRSFWEMAQIVEGFKYDYLVSNNGTTIHKNGSIILDNVVAHKEAKAVRDILISNNISFVIKSVTNSFWWGANLLAPEQYDFYTQGRDVNIITDNVLSNDTWISFCAIINTTIFDLHELEKKLQKLVGDSFDILVSGMYSIDILIQDVNKGSGAEFVMNLENWSWDEVATIGDNLNDIPMLKPTPHSFAMSHGRSETKTSASYTVDTASQAFEKILELNKVNDD